MSFTAAIKGGVGWLEVGIRQKVKSHLTADIECHQRQCGLLRFYYRTASRSFGVRLLIWGRVHGLCRLGAAAACAGLRSGFVVASLVLIVNCLRDRQRAQELVGSGFFSSAHFSDRGHLFQADRGRRFRAIVDAQGNAKSPSSGL